MLTLRHNMQICRVVVMAVAVYVMHDFGGLQKPAQFPLHNQAMLHDISLAIAMGMVRCFQGVICAIQTITDATYAMGCVLAHHVFRPPFVLALHAAEFLSTRLISRKRRTALRASIFYEMTITPPGFQIAPLRTILTSPLVGHNELYLTMLAYLLHINRIPQYLASVKYISEEYCQIARDRFKAVDTGVPVKEARAGQMALFGEPQ